MPETIQRRGIALSLRALRRNAPLIAVFVALGALLAFALVGTRSSYLATAEIVVSPLPEQDQTLLGLSVLRNSRESARAIETAAVLVDSPEAASRAALLLGADAEILLDQVEVDIVGESNVLAVRAEAGTPERAARTANTFAAAALAVQRDRLRSQVSRTLSLLRDRLQALGADDPSAAALNARITALEALLASGGDPTLALGQSARAPAGAAGASTWLVLLLGALAGLVLGVLAAMVRERTGRRINDESALTAVYPLPTLARVPLVRRPLRRRGASFEVPPFVRETFRTVVAQLERRRPDRSSNRVLLVTGASAGDGTTTAAACIGEALAEAGYSVAAVDCNLRRPRLAPSLGLAPADGVRAALEAGPGSAWNFVEETAMPGLGVLPALAGDERSLPATYRALPAIVAELRSRHEWTILDSPAVGEVSDALRLLAGADEVLLVCRLGNTGRSSLRVARDLLAHAEAGPMGTLLFGASLPPAASDRGRRREDLVAG